jgi:hypothetical protein
MQKTLLNVVEGGNDRHDGHGGLDLDGGDGVYN